MNSAGDRNNPPASKSKSRPNVPDGLLSLLRVDTITFDHFHPGLHAHFCPNEKGDFHWSVLIDQNKVAGFAALSADCEDLFHRGARIESDGVDLLQTIRAHLDVSAPAKYIPRNLAVVEAVDFRVSLLAELPCGGGELTKQRKSFLFLALAG